MLMVPLPIIGKCTLGLCSKKDKWFDLLMNQNSNYLW